MAIQLTVKQTEIPKPIPEGLYKAYLKEIEEGTGEFGDYLRFSFIVVDGKFKNSLKSAVASKKLSVSKSGKVSKLYGFVKALMGKDIDAGETLDLEKLKGKSCQILVKNDREIDGVMFQKVAEVMPL